VIGVKDLAQEPQFLARGMIHQSSVGVPEPGITPQLSQTPGTFRRPVYKFGEHTREVLGELGYTDDQITGMEHDGAVWSRDEL
jgi:formyl-CoA transferase